MGVLPVLDHFPNNLRKYIRNAYNNLREYIRTAFNNLSILELHLTIPRHNMAAININNPKWRAITNEHAHQIQRLKNNMPGNI